MNEKLFLNTLTFEYPKEPVKLYFSDKDDAERKSTRLKSPLLIPKEVKQSNSFTSLFASTGTPTIYTSFSSPTEGFEVIAIDFNEPQNKYFVKRYYNRLLERYFRYYDDMVVTKSGITDDIQVWLLTNGDKKHINHDNKQYELMEMDRFTIRVKYDHFNNSPYLLVANDRPALMLNVPIARLLYDEANDPFTSRSGITPSMINKVMTREVRKGSDGTEYVVRRIDRYDYLQSHNKYCPPETTRPIMSGELKRFFGLDKREETRTFESKYIKYLEKIENFRKKFLNTKDIERIFPNLAYEFTKVNPLQVERTSSSTRMLIFGKDSNGNDVRNVRQQIGVNSGPRIKCPYTDIQLIAIYHTNDKHYASHLLGYFRNGNYGSENNDERKNLEMYIGTNVSYADKVLHIEFKDMLNPTREIEEALYGKEYRNLNPKIKYVGIYVSPIHKYASSKESKECYYKIKEMFLKHNIPTQCIDSNRMRGQLE